MMTEGKILPILIKFSIPLLLSGILQQAYSWTDALIVGNYIGENALAAIGATNTISTLFIAIFMGFSVGVSILVSQNYGRENFKVVGKALHSFSLMAGLLSAALSVAGFFAARPLLELIQTPADILDISTLYIKIIFLGIPFMSVYNIYSAVLRGIGDSRTPLYAMIVSSVLNIGLDILLVAVIPLGIQGAAIATAASQALMVVFVVAYTYYKHPISRPKMDGELFEKAILGDGFSLAIPTMIQSMVRSLGSLLLQNIMNSFGTVVVAAITTAYRIDTLLLLPAVNMGAGITTFTAQNKGADEKIRTKQGLKIGAGMLFAVTLVLAVFITITGGRVMALFGVSREATAIGWEFLIICSVFYPVFGLMTAATSYLQGLGDVKFTGFITIFSLGVRIVLSYALAGWLSYRVIAVSELVSWVLQTIACWMRIQYMNKAEESNKPAL